MKQKIFTEGRVRMDEHGGRLFLEEGRRAGGGGRAMNVIEQGKAIWTACQLCCSKTFTFRGRRFLCADHSSN